MCYFLIKWWDLRFSKEKIIKTICNTECQKLLGIRQIQIKGFFPPSHVTDFTKFTNNFNPLLLNTDLKVKVSYALATEEFVLLVKLKHLDFFIYMKSVLLGKFLLLHWDSHTELRDKKQATSAQQTFAKTRELSVCPSIHWSDSCPKKGQAVAGAVADAGALHALKPSTLTFLPCSSANWQFNMLLHNHFDAPCNFAALCSALLYGLASACVPLFLLSSQICWVEVFMRIHLVFSSSFPTTKRLGLAPLFAPEKTHLSQELILWELLSTPFWFLKGLSDTNGRSELGKSWCCTGNPPTLSLWGAPPPHGIWAAYGIWI